MVYDHVTLKDACHMYQWCLLTRLNNSKLITCKGKMYQRRKTRNKKSIGGI